MSKPPSNPLWQIIDAVAIVFSRAYMLARTRAASCPSPVLRMMARRDHTHWEARMLDRELAVFREQRSAVNAVSKVQRLSVIKIDTTFQPRLAA